MLSHPYLPCLHTLLEGFFQDPLQLLLDVFYVFKMGPLNDSYELVEEGKNQTESGQLSREAVSAQHCSSWPETVGCSGHFEQAHCHTDAAMSCSPQLSHFLAH